MIKHISPKEAHNILQQDTFAILIDVRSMMEYHFVGHPQNALHLPLKEPPQWQTHLDFGSQLKQLVRSHFTENQFSEEQLMQTALLLFICRSGQRSLEAAEIGQEIGFQQVFNVAEGFEGERDSQGHRSNINGWRYHQLPWEQS